MQGIFTGADEGFDFQVLLERSEEGFNLPAVLVNGADGHGPQLQMIGQKNQNRTADGLAHHHPAQNMWALGVGLQSSEINELIGQDVAVGRDLAALPHDVISVFLLPGHKEDAVFGPAAEQSEVGIATVHDHNGTLGQRNATSNRAIILLAVGDTGKAGQIPVVV